VPIVPLALPVGLVPISTSPPTISGSAQQGQTVTCSKGSWTNSPTSYTYSWQRNVATPIGTGANTYTLTAADVNQAITCTVVAHNSSGSSAPALSVPIVPLALPVGLVPVATSLPAISGKAQQGQTVTCSNGSWTNNPTSYLYSWWRAGSQIAGQASAQYTLTTSDVGHPIICAVMAHNAAGNSLPAISLPIIPVALPVGLVPVLTSLPAISGKAQQGQTVTCSNGSWTNNPTSYLYSWWRAGVRIGGQASGRYTLTTSDVGRPIICAVMAHNAAGNSLPAISLPIIPSSGGGKPKPHAPTIKAFSVPHSVVVTVRGKRQSTKGAIFRYTLDQKAGVLLEIQQRLTGRVKGKSCVAATSKNRKSKPCARYVKVKLFTIKSAKAGANQLTYLGRVGNHLIGPGTYRTVIVAVGAGGWSKERSGTFTVVRKKAPTKRARKHPVRTR
jgi:hypothetical protein